MSKYYIVRNKDNTLRVFQNKPAKHGWNFWDAVDDYPTKLKENWFPEVKWTDKEPKVLTIEESPWIKVEDRLPVDKEIVFVLYKQRKTNEVCYGTNSLLDGKWVTCSDSWKLIAWMPIPEFKE